MKRFFVEEMSDKDKTVLIMGKELHHLKNVLRLKKDDEVVVFDGKGLELLGNIEKINKNEARVIVKKRLVVSRESPLEIILAIGLTKAEKIDFVIQKATELGVSRIIPFVTSRVIPRLDSKQIIKKTERWQRIALEAAKQCGRSIVPKVEKLVVFADVLKDWAEYLKIIPWEGERKNTLKGILRPSKYKGCIVLTGTEGGFSYTEVAEAKKAGFIPVTLGPRILRAETAAISAVAIIQYELGDLGGLQRGKFD